MFITDLHLVDGDCGSWVLDAETGHVYGHVVSGYPTGGSAYIIPAYQIVQDIQKQLGQPVAFTKKQYSKILPSNDCEPEDTPPVAPAPRSKSPTQRTISPPKRATVEDDPESSTKAGPSQCTTINNSENQPPTKQIPSPIHTLPAWTRLPPPPLPMPPRVRYGYGPLPPPPGAGPPPPFGIPMQMPIRQQQIRIQDITPPKMMDEAACLKKLTTYAAYTIRKVPPIDKKGSATWARAEVIEERFSQEDIIKQVKKLNENRRSLADKKSALAPNQQGQVTKLLDELVSKERDRAFEWSLAQLDSVVKRVNSKGGKRGGGQYETATMKVFVKRAPLKDLNPVILFQQIETKADSMRPPPPPPPRLPQPGPQSGLRNEFIDLNLVESKDSKNRAPSRSRRYHDPDDSGSEFFDSDSDSVVSFGSDSFDTSISSRSRSYYSRGHSPRRSHSRHREPPRPFDLNQRRPHSPDHWGGPPRPYVPDVPHVIPAIATSVPYDPIEAAYEAGKADADAQRYGTTDRIVERVIEPRPVVSYGRMNTRSPAPRFVDDDELRRDKDYLLRPEREAEEYIESRLDGGLSGPSTEAYSERRQTEPMRFIASPFSPTPFGSLPHNYPPSGCGW